MLCLLCCRAPPSPQPPPHLHSFSFFCLPRPIATCSPTCTGVALLARRRKTLNKGGLDEKAHRPPLRSAHCLWQQDDLVTHILTQLDLEEISVIVSTDHLLARWAREAALHKMLDSLMPLLKAKCSNAALAEVSRSLSRHVFDLETPSHGVSRGCMLFALEYLMLTLAKDDRDEGTDAAVDRTLETLCAALGLRLQWRDPLQ
jgi:hypothetical protein